MNYVYKISLVLAIIGGINWGLVGLFNFNLVETITMGYNVWSRIIYTIVCIASLICILILFLNLKERDCVFDK
ncbi:MAG: DUF378 domain-containing protein [Bacillales bacterium]|nr:DUF378 domain-containing protein [Bacillales bacterium]